MALTYELSTEEAAGWKILRAGDTQETLQVEPDALSDIALCASVIGKIFLQESVTSIVLC